MKRQMNAIRKNLRLFELEIGQALHGDGQASVFIILHHRTAHPSPTQNAAQVLLLPPSAPFLLSFFIDQMLYLESLNSFLC
jgi:hypothetical protein